MPPKTDTSAFRAPWLPPAAARPSARKVVAAAAAGNLLEWYDWAVFGFLITYIGLNFFPASSGHATLLLTFATFGAGFLMRPLGALVMGWVGERHGRKTALTATLFIMAAGTVPIAFIPSYDSIGIWAPLLLLACRLLQGFSTGGEMGGSLAFLAEWAPGRHRGFYVSFQQTSTHGGTLLGSGIAALLNASLGAQDMADWGWRLPFLLGGLLLPLALWLRGRIGETPAYLAVHRPPPAPVPLPAPVRAPALQPCPPLQFAAEPQPPVAPQPAAQRTRAAAGLARAIGLIAAPVACQYLFFTYLATFAVRHGGLSEADALAANTAALAVMVLCTPLMGALSDRIGRKPLLVAASAILLLAAAPVFEHVAAGAQPAGLLAMQAALALVVAMLHGAGPVAVTELFATRGRALLVSLAYGLGVALAGGFAPFIATWLIGWTGAVTAPALYIAAACAITGAVALNMPETAQLKLA